MEYGEIKKSVSGKNSTTYSVIVCITYVMQIKQNIPLVEGDE